MVNMAALLLLPRRWAALPLLVGACYITRGAILELGPFHLSVERILIVAGLVRIFIRGERLEGRINGLDWLMLIWPLWILVSSLFHKDPSAAFVYRLGLAFDAWGIYFLVRLFCQSFDDILGLCRFTAFLLLPVAIEMIYEKFTEGNIFYFLSGVPEYLLIREDHIRAKGPFAHAIIAGTVGATCLPLMAPLWHQHRKAATIGIGACVVMIFACASSGPIMSMIVALGALIMWRHRQHTRMVRWMAVAAYIALDLYMKVPAYYIIAKIDLVGGSTGWHRARLIESAFEHLSEWWLSGTDYTRHWMPSGVSWSPDHTDITNHYLQVGVIGGVASTLLFVAILIKGFFFVGQTVRQIPESSPHSQFMIWAIGGSLFAHAITFISVSYFDQSVIFIYLTLATISSAWSATVPLETIHAAADIEQRFTDSEERMNIVR